MKALLKLPKAVQGNITKKIEFLATDPYADHNDVKKLSGELDAIACELVIIELYTA